MPPSASRPVAINASDAGSGVLVIGGVPLCATLGKMSHEYAGYLLYVLPWRAAAARADEIATVRWRGVTQVDLELRRATARPCLGVNRKVAGIERRRGRIREHERDALTEQQTQLGRRIVGFSTDPRPAEVAEILNIVA